MTIDELNAQIGVLVEARDALLENLRAQSAAFDAAQATAGDEYNAQLAAAQATFDEMVAVDAADEIARDGALADAASLIPSIPALGGAPPDQTGNIGAVPG
jgi:hypothetical protein